MFLGSKLRVSAALALCASPTFVNAATPLVQSTAHVVVLFPLTATKLQDMDFGDLSTTTGGTAVLDPNTDTLSTTGAVVALGGSPHCAQFAGVAGSASVVNIKAPNGSVTLKRSGGTETMTLSSFSVQGQSKRALAKAESFTFRVGGKLTVGANQVEGLYTGTFSVTVQYP